jgi:hypothetical protein
MRKSPRLARLAGILLREFFAVANLFNLGRVE